MSQTSKGWKVKPIVQVPERPAKERIHDFEEVSLGYTEEMAMSEAERCLHCPHQPCVQACPVHVNVPQFLKQVQEGKFEEAYLTIVENNKMPAITGRVCRHMCEDACPLGRINLTIQIANIERFTGEWGIKHGLNKEVRKKYEGHGKIAVVGSGPAGIANAAEMAELGYDVTIFEALHKPGGVLIYGIPEFRLPKKTVEEEFEYLRRLGVQIDLGILVGRTLTVGDLLKDFDFVFLGSGAGAPHFLNIPGEQLPYIYSANEFLTRINLMKSYLFPKYPTPLRIGEVTAVIGAGDTAIDAARAAIRKGSDTYILYRRSELEVPARNEEVVRAREEGVKFVYLVSPLSFMPDVKGRLGGVELIKMKLGDPDSTGRRKPEPINGSTYIMKIQTAIIAIGAGPNPLIRQTTTGLVTNDKHGTIIVGNGFRTSLSRIYAGGDIVLGEGTVVEAMSHGRMAALEMHHELLERRVV